MLSAAVGRFLGACEVKMLVLTRVVLTGRLWAAGMLGHPPGSAVLYSNHAALNMPANLENSAVATGLEKVSFHSNPKKGNAKECSDYHTIALISHAIRVKLKILQDRLQQYLN